MSTHRPSTGTWTVTGTYSTVNDNTSLTVNHGALHHVVISPDTATITAGSTQTYSAQSFDQFNNVIADISNSTVFSITPAAGGGWNGSIYTSASTWTVTGTYVGLTDTASLTVNAGALHHIVISPDTSTITAGDTQSYAAQSFDMFNNLIATSPPRTYFHIQAGAGGTWATNVYTSESAGTWTRHRHLHADRLRHSHPDRLLGALHHIVISPAAPPSLRAIPRRTPLSHSTCSTTPSLTSPARQLHH